MRVVVYLSGTTGRSLKWHREQDSVAACVVVPKQLEQRFVQELYNTGLIEQVELPKLTANDPPLELSPDCLNDMLSDLEDDSEFTEFSREVIEHVCGCEALCSVVHLVTTGRA